MALFVAVAFLSAYWLGTAGVWLGRLAIMIAIVRLDLAWIDVEIHRPGWDGAPDRDVIFLLGVAIRVVLINAVLIPVNILALRKRPSNQSAGRYVEARGFNVEVPTGACANPETDHRREDQTPKRR